MEMKVETISSEKIKPSSPTPDHLKNFKMCLIDELAPSFYVPIILLYSSDEFRFNKIVDGDWISVKLKKSLAKAIALFYPLCGKLKGNLSLECSDDGALYVETKVNVSVSEIRKNPETESLYKLLPFDPYCTKIDMEGLITAVQLNIFSCGGVGIGLCMSHKIADVSTMSAFLDAWAATANGLDQARAPWMDAATIFPPKGTELIESFDIVRQKDIVTKRFKFSSTNLSKLKAEVRNVGNISRIQAVTALIWKSALVAYKINSGKKNLPPSTATHAVNIRGRMDPPLPENAIGNILRVAFANYMEPKGDINLDELVGLFQKSIQNIDDDCINHKLIGENLGFKLIEPLKEVREQLESGSQQVYVFSSWTRFPLHQLDFGWGRPTRVFTLTLRVKNYIVLMSTKNGDGIEAWVSLTEEDMKEFEKNEELLQFVST